MLHKVKTYTRNSDVFEGRDPIFVIEQEPNDATPNGPWTAPVRIEGHIYPVNDVDTFLVELPTTGTVHPFLTFLTVHAGNYTFETFSGGCTTICVGDTEIEIWDRAGTRMLHSNDDSETSYCSLVHPKKGCPLYWLCDQLDVRMDAGVYLLKVKTFIASRAASYAFSISTLNFNPCGDEVVDSLISDLRVAFFLLCGGDSIFLPTIFFVPR